MFTTRRLTPSYSFFLLCLLATLLFLSLNLPRPITSRLSHASLFFTDLFAYVKVDTQEMETVRYKVENQMLRNQIEEIKQWLYAEDRIEAQRKKLHDLEHYLQKSYVTPFYERRIAELTTLLEKQHFSLSAKVIFREPASWSNSIWITVGEADNQRFQERIVQKNSPVLCDESIVGIVEEVCQNRSRVRLITDSMLTPAVRVARGDAQCLFYQQLIEQLEDHLHLHEEHNRTHLKALNALKTEFINQEHATKFLAKGILRGASEPLWRCTGTTLKGIGFNYDFADAEGIAHPMHTKDHDPIISTGDLLITSGMDGLFPAGLNVAIVRQIYPLKEGSFAYTIEAEPTCKKLNELSYVQVLPPLL